MPKKKSKKSITHKRQDPFILAIIHTVIILGFTAIAVFVVGNMMASQYIPSLFVRMTQGEKNAMVTFYSIARAHGLKNEILQYMNTDMSVYANDIFAANRNRQELISSYESLLQYNPNARDILYALALLYKQEKNTTQAQYYMRQALAVDPMIGR